MHPAGGMDFTLMLVLGLTSSLHCAAMCGPIIAVASAPVSGLGGGAPRLGAIAAWQAAYHLGRGATYLAIGAALAMMGTAITALFDARLLGGIVQLAVGLVIVGIGAWQLRAGRGAAATRDGPLTRAIRALVTSGHAPGMLGLGLVTGLLPCGVLYAAFARAVAAGSAAEGALLMLAFWLGTVPLLAALGVASGGVFRALGRHAAVLLFAATLTTGVWVAAKGYRNITLPPAAAEIPHCQTHESPLESTH